VPSERSSDGPVRPGNSPTLVEFGAALRALRTWAGLTMSDLTKLHDHLRVQTISGYELGRSMPAWEWAYDFITGCLTHPKPPRHALSDDQLRAEITSWQDAWTYTKQHPTAPPPETQPPAAAPDDTVEPHADAATAAEVVPAQLTTDVDTDPASATVADDPAEQTTAAPASADQPPPTGPPPQPALEDDRPAEQPPQDAAPARGQRSRLLIAVGAAAVVIVAVLAVVLGNNPGASTAENPPAPAPAAQAPTSVTSSPPGPAPGQPPQIRDDTVDNLAPSQAYDFDYDAPQPDETAPGMDLSTNRLNYTLNSVATERGGRLVRLPPGTNPQDRAACDAIPADRWTKNVPGMPIGGSVCLHTDEQNLVILTITKAWANPTDNTISFRYRIWYH